MKYGLCVVLSLLVGIAAVIQTSGLWRDSGLSAAASARAAEKAEKQDQKRKGPPPLVVDKSAPLLLEEPPEEDPWDVPAGAVADNIACYCCHTNYQEDEFVVYHAKANVGCVKCHGPSHAHCDDEDNITPPEVMFPPEKIASNCRECHETHDAPARKVIALWQERCPKKTKPEELLCTDCHGRHRLESRTVRWDKKTGKLIVRGRKISLKKVTAPHKTKALPEKKASPQKKTL